MPRFALLSSMAPRACIRLLSCAVKILLVWTESREHRVGGREYRLRGKYRFRSNFRHGCGPVLYWISEIFILWNCCQSDGSPEPRARLAVNPCVQVMEHAERCSGITAASTKVIHPAAYSSSGRNIWGLVVKSTQRVTVSLMQHPCKTLSRYSIQQDDRRKKSVCSARNNRRGSAGGITQ
jgi:hypothetical protein